MPCNKLEKIISHNIRFSAFFPLNATINKNIFSVIGNAEVKDTLKPFPTFRAGVINPAHGKVETWWLWDGESEKRIGRLNKKQRSLPIRGVWNDTLLIERLEQGWTPKTDSST